MIALALGFVVIATAAMATSLLARHPDVHHPAVSREVHEAVMILRLDPPHVPAPVQGAVWAMVVVGGLVAAYPLVGWSEASLTPALAVVWLLGLTTLALGMWGLQAGLGWLAPSRRLGVGPDEVWWETVDRHGRPTPAPTSAAERQARSTLTLSFDEGDAIVVGPGGSGVVFGPLDGADEAALLAHWGKPTP